MNEKKVRKISTSAILAFILIAFSVISLGAFGVTNFGSIHLADTNGTATPVFRVNSTGPSAIVEFLDGGTPVATWNDGGSFVSGGAIDLNGQQLIMDADGNTSLTADTNNQIDIEVAGADDFVITANLFESQTGSVIDLNGTQLTIDADGNTTMIANVDNIVTVTLGAAAGRFDILTGNLRVGNGTPGITQDGEDTYLEGMLEVDGLVNFSGVFSQPINIENFGNGKTILSQVITYTAAAGGSGTIATVADGEIWFVHSVFIRTTTDFDATGDDVTFTIGDGNVAAGFINAADASLQAAFTEDTGYAPGWYGIENGSGGAYTLDDGGPFVYAPSGAPETIDWLLDESSGETITAGSLTAYIIYTRIQ